MMQSSDYGAGSGGVDPGGLLIHGFGTIGFVLILGAYWLVSSGRTTGAAPRYQLMNLAGAAVLVVYSALLGAWVSVALNVVWALIALHALRVILARRAK